MAHLVRLQSRPLTKELSPDEIKTLEKRFEINANQITIDGKTLELDRVDEIEVVKAARAASPAGWLVKNVLYGGDRYHVGIYAGRAEIVFSNVSLGLARYVVGNIAFFARNTVRYKGLDDIAPVTDY
ncbi:MAG: hypothetical protein SGI73_03535 [Chloroflexota bacterium]|nr:hypothetical protein [Chloroflexota bacterium]